MTNYSNDIKRLVKERLLAIPPNISFSVGNYGDFTPEQLIEEIEQNSDVGNAMVEMQIEFIRSMPKILNKYAKV